MRRRASSNTTTQPLCKDSSTAARFAIKSAAWRSGPSVCCLPEEDQRWFALRSQRKQGPEIGVGRNDDAIFVLRAVENIIVSRGLQPVIANMNGIVASLPEKLGEKRRHGVVDEKS